MSLLDEVVREALGPPLGEAGFHRRRRTWTRSAGDLVDVIDAQETRLKGEGRTSFTLNVGVLEPRIYRLCWGREAPPSPQETDCTVRRRLGELAGEAKRRDLWWDLTAETAAQVGAEAAGCLRRLALPFLAECHSLEDLTRLLEVDSRQGTNRPLATLYLGIGLAVGGRAAAGLEAVRGVAATFPSWAARAEEVAGRLCTHRAEQR